MRAWTKIEILHRTDYGFTFGERLCFLLLGLETYNVYRYSKRNAYGYLKDKRRWPYKERKNILIKRHCAVNRFTNKQQIDVCSRDDHRFSATHHRKLMLCVSGRRAALPRACRTNICSFKMRDFSIHEITRRRADVGCHNR